MQEYLKHREMICDKMQGFGVLVIVVIELSGYVGMLDSRPQTDSV